MTIVDRARDVALARYGSESELEHPLEVARLVEQAGAAPRVVAAAVLHDLLEDTDADLDEVRAQFGSEVADLVAPMTEDASIGDYLQRKEEHRRRAAAAGPDAALIFVADKLSNARRMRRGKKKPNPKKLGHYTATLQLMRATHPDMPLLAELDRELQP